MEGSDSAKADTRGAAKSRGMIGRVVSLVLVSVVVACVWTQTRSSGSAGSQVARHVAVVQEGTACEREVRERLGHGDWVTQAIKSGARIHVSGMDEGLLASDAKADGILNGLKQAVLVSVHGKQVKLSDGTVIKLDDKCAYRDVFVSEKSGQVAVAAREDSKMGHKRCTGHHTQVACVRYGVHCTVQVPKSLNWFCASQTEKDCTTFLQKLCPKGKGLEITGPRRTPGKRMFCNYKGCGCGSAKLGPYCNKLKLNTLGCPLSKTSCGSAPQADYLGQSSSVVSDVMKGLQIGAKIMKVIPKLKVVASVINVVAGLFGDDGMSAEEAYNKMVTEMNKMMREMHACVEKKFAEAARQDIVTGANFIRNLLHGLPPGRTVAAARARNTNFWEPGSVECLRITEMFGSYYVNQVTKGDIHNLLPEVYGTLQMCASVFMSYIADIQSIPDNQQIGGENVKVQIYRMQRVARAIQRFTKLAMEYMSSSENGYMSGLVCGYDLLTRHLAAQKVMFLQNAVAIPVAVFADAVYGASVYDKAVLRYVNVRKPRIGSKYLTNFGSVTSNEQCLSACLGTRECRYAWVSRSGSECIGYKLKSVRSGKGGVYYYVKSGVATVPFVPALPLNGNGVRYQMLRQSRCQNMCVYYGDCAASFWNAKTNKCEYSRPKAPKLMQADYVVVHDGTVTKLEKTYYTGRTSTPTYKPVTESRCLLKCVGDTRLKCVGIDYNRASRSCWIFKGLDNEHGGQFVGTYDSERTLARRNGEVHYNVYRKFDPKNSNLYTSLYFLGVPIALLYPPAQP